MAYFNIDNFYRRVADSGFQRTNQFRCRIDVGAIGAAADAGSSQETSHRRDSFGDAGRFFGSTSPKLGLYLKEKYPTASEWLAEGLLCEQTNTPSRELENTTLGIYGYDETYPVYTTYVDQRCSFYAPLIDRGNKQHNDVASLFHEWQNGIQRRAFPNGDDADMVLRFPDEYRLSEGMVLEQLSTYNPKRRGGLLGVNVNAQGNVRDGIRRFNQVSRWFNGPQIPDRFRWEWGNGEDGDSEETLSYEFFNVFPQTVQSSEVDWAGMNEFQRVTVSFTYSYWHLKQTAAGSQIDVGEQLEWGRFGDEHNLDPNKTNYYMNGR